jgi:hypothetical protein
MTRIYLTCLAITDPFASREASAAGRLRSNEETGKLKYQAQHGRFASLSRADAISQQATWTWLGLADCGTLPLTKSGSWTLSVTLQT